MAALSPGLSPWARDGRPSGAAEDETIADISFLTLNNN